MTVASDRLTGTGTAGAREDTYDVVVVGGGLGGLTAGAMLARSGKKVLVVDANERPGGYARTIVDGPYTFDMADHLIFGCAPESPFGPGVIDAVLRHLDVRDRCDFFRVDDPFYVARFPDLSLAAPHGREAFVEAHARHFSGEAAGLRHLVELSASVAREFAALPIAPSPLDLLEMPLRFPTLFRYRNATVQQVIDATLTDPRAKAAYLALWPWMGRPARSSFLIWATMMAYYVEDGAYYCRGGFQSLADALADGLRLAGGQLLLATRVTGILVDGGQVRGVALDNGQQVRAQVVISNVDARDTFGQLIDAHDVPARYLRRLRAMERSMAVVALRLATDLDVRALGATLETMLYAAWHDAETSYAAALAGQVPLLAVRIPTLMDPSLAPTAEHAVTVAALAAPAGGEGTVADGDRLAARMLELAEGMLPGLRNHLTHVEGAESGVTRFPLHRMEPIYGWALSPAQSGPRRLPQTTPVPGLYLAGHWTRPAHGVPMVIQSGVQAARLILGIAPRASALPLRLPSLTPVG